MGFQIAIVQTIKKIKDSLWQEIADALNGILSVIEIQKKWKNLRDKFVKVHQELTSYKPSGSGTTNSPKPWKYYPQLLFLRDTVTPKRTVSNIEHTALLVNTTEEAIPSTSSSEISPCQPLPRKRTKHADDGTIETRLLKALETSLVPIQPPTFMQPPPLYQGNMALSTIAEIVSKLPIRKRTELEISMLNAAYNALQEEQQNDIM